MKLNDVLDKKLSGWQKMFCYFLELDHALFGQFPVIKSGTKKIVVCPDRNDLEKIWLKLPRRKTRVRKAHFYVNKRRQMAIFMNSQREGDSDSESFFLVLGDKLDAYLAEENFFAWLPGCVSLKDESDAVFPEE